MTGKVNSSSDRRPSVSMVHTAGKAPTKLRKPKTQEASNAPKSENPASEKICRRRRTHSANQIACGCRVFNPLVEAYGRGHDVTYRGRIEGDDIYCEEDLLVYVWTGAKDW